MTTHVSSTATKEKKQKKTKNKGKQWVKTLMWVRGQIRQPAEMRGEHLHCAIMYSKWLHKCFSLSSKKKKVFKKRYLFLEASLKVSLCYPFRGDDVKIPTNGIPTASHESERNLSRHKKIIMMLPLGFCRFKDCCYIKTARNYVQHREKRL